MSVHVPSDWFKTWFNSPYYPILYRNRNQAEANRFIDNLVDYLNPPKGSQMLDLACGRGRHSLHLCQKGYHVTGIDISPEAIKAAEQLRCGNLDFEVHDMRVPYGEAEYDYVFNFFTSFGYFDHESDNLKTIHAIYAALKPGGIGMIDFLNVQRVIDNLKEHETIERDGLTFQIEKSYQEGFILKHIQFRDQDEDFEFIERLQALTLKDFKRLLEAGGLELTETFGNYSLDPFDPNTSPRLILLFRKPNA